MIFNFILTGMSVAGIAIIWRNWLEDHPNLKNWIKNTLGRAHKTLTCGSCFTYWLALILTYFVEPLRFWLPFNAEFYIGNILLQWMALSWLSIFLRFAYIALQELVSYQVHTLKHNHK